ncbi:hypothetical protein [Sphingopyxis sp. MWB1]|uniref:hypothetical protein n=1 Tax=Sphingopyxis sp. MWB1 TaxID=1537715 RepID=UPI000AD7F13C|nr:hypothetical protein [Sphingopyxis sp. MWB1]
MEHSDDKGAQGWERRWVLIPRMGLRLTEYGTERQWLWPGRYLAHWSRSMGKWVYRRMR